MKSCLRCGKSLLGKHPAAKYCCAACRVAGQVYRQTGKMPGTKRGGKRPGAGRKPKQQEPTSKPKQKRKQDKSNLHPQFIYTWHTQATDRTVRRYGNYDAPVYEYFIHRYEVHKDRNRLFLYCNLYETAALGEAVIGEWEPPETIPDSLDWNWNRKRTEREIRATVEKKHSYWRAADLFPIKYYTARQIENQWAKEREQVQQQQAESNKQKDEWIDQLDELLDKIAGPQREARELLGVGREATQSEIKAAYRKLSLKHHPDRGGDSKTFANVSAAYELLTR